MLGRNKSYNETPTASKSSGSFLSRTLSSKRDRSNSVGGKRRPSPPLQSPSPLLTRAQSERSTTTNLQMKYATMNDADSDDSSGNSTPQFSSPKDLPTGAFGKARDRSTFKGVFDKFVGSFNGKIYSS